MRGHPGGVGRSVKATISLAIEGELCAETHDCDRGNPVDPTADADWTIAVVKAKTTRAMTDGDELQGSQMPMRQAGLAN